MTVPYPGYKIVEEVNIKYKYIELCYFYAGSTYFYITKATVIPYNIITRKVSEGEDAILIML
jgi:hypothetical protein